MLDSKTVNTLLGHPIKILIMKCHKSKDVNKIMKSKPYASGIGSIMCDMFCRRLDITCTMRIVS